MSLTDHDLDQDRYDAVVAKDPGSDGVFVFAVSTTGIYCRPSCPSRPAKREHLSFFADARRAEAAGFRACKRCHPQHATSPVVAVVVAACRSIDAAVVAGDDVPDLEALASTAGLSRFHFQRVFAQHTGLTPLLWAQAARARVLRNSLDDGDSVTAAIHAAGYGSTSRFYDKSADVLGMTATTYKRGGAGETIRFSVGPCALGQVLVASSSRGVCAVSLGDDPQALIDELHARFDKATIVGADAAHDDVAATVIAVVEGRAAGSSLPLDLRGTAFQQQVWRALRDIPVGSTVSYAQLAETIGAPSSSRAVAQACGANSVAVIVPCHRVVRADGGLSGYRWGVERKRALLEREGARP
ncbi:MAG TPA: bifunctional DNA-binding transcriptional regulator/O6-methylguanine-DNA methyltransferase Ada [Myxococcota bacterium]